jgi:hypothetical protein
MPCYVLQAVIASVSPAQWKSVDLCLEQKICLTNIQPKDVYKILVALLEDAKSTARQIHHFKAALPKHLIQSPPFQVEVAQYTRKYASAHERD